MVKQDEAEPDGISRRDLLARSAAAAMVVGASAAATGGEEKMMTRSVTGFREKLLACLGGPWPEAGALRAKVGKTIDKLQKLNNKWTRLKGKVSSTITQVANAEVMASFSFEYQRLETSKSLLEAFIDIGRITAKDGYHKDLIKGKMAPKPTPMWIAHTPDLAHPRR